MFTMRTKGKYSWLIYVIIGVAAVVAMEFIKPEWSPVSWFKKKK